MPTTKKLVKIIKTKTPAKFYTVSVVEKENSPFYPQYNVLLKTVESVNSFYSLYKFGRKDAKGGPSTHAQQDLYRAMLVFACAGLDALVKQLIKSKLPKLIVFDSEAKNKFKEYVKRGINKDDKTVLNTIALALIDHNPRRVFLNEYIESLTGDSLQSVAELCKVSEASGLNKNFIFTNSKMNSLKDAFLIRNQIIHEMDINVSSDNSNSTGYRTRRQRIATNMEQHTKNILSLGEELFSAYKEKFEKLRIDVDKKSPEIKDII